MQYNSIKKCFRNEQRQRKKALEYERNCLEELSKTQELDQKFFWYTVNKNKKKSSNISPIHDETGQILTNAEDIRKEWTRYYKTLYSTQEFNTTDSHFDNLVTNTVKHLCETRPNRYDLEDGPITKQEVSDEISKMKGNKSPGWDLITAEYLKHSGDVTISSVTMLLNLVVRKDEMPQHLKRGLIVPIPKAQKDRTIKNNNRGITLLPVIYKLLERIILRREKDWFG